jgi:polyphosphate kinase
MHLGTGNYNAGTARLYTDLGMLTCDDEIAADVSDLFNVLTGFSKQRRGLAQAVGRARDAAPGADRRRSSARRPRHAPAGRRASSRR